MIFQENELWWRERWPATFATLIAIGLFWLSNGPNPIVIFLMGIWLLGYFVTGRISANPAVIWVARIVLYSIVYFGNIGRPTNLADSILLEPGIAIYGQIAIAEFALRRWRSGIVPLWADILPSGVIMLAACSTTEPLYVTFLAPLYFLFIVLAFAQIGHRADAPLPWRWLNLATRVSCLLIAIGIGGFAHYCFRQYKSEILDWGGNMLGEHAASAGSQLSITGIAKAPQLGPTFNGGASPARMLLIHGSLESPYMRGMSYTDYLHGSWGPTLDARQYNSVGAHGLTVPTSGPTDSIKVDRLVTDDDMVTFPLECSTVVVPSNDSMTWAQNEGGPLRVAAFGPLQYRCTFPSAAGFQGIACAPPTPIQRRRLLDIPIGIDRRVSQLGRTLTQGVDGAAAIMRVERYLMSNNRYSYATNPGAGDPVSNFILRHKSADCEYFASAATLLLRSGGIPTRFVIGYYAHESGADGIIVRATDAHAWAESYVDGTGWVTVDATPASGRPDVTQKLGLWWQFRDRWDDFIGGLQARWAAMSRLHQAMAVVGIAILVGLYYLLRNWRSGARKIVAAYRYSPPEPTLFELSARFDRLLSSRQAPCPRGVPWRDHIQRLMSTEEGGAKIDTDLAARFVSAYSVARFGNGADRASTTKLSEMLGELESEKR